MSDQSDILNQLKTWVEGRPDSDNIDFCIEMLQDIEVPSKHEMLKIMTWLQSANYSGIFPFLEDQVNQKPVAPS